MGVVSTFVDEWMTWGASFLYMCTEGKHNNWSILFARVFYTECPCCNFYRGVTVGVVITTFLTMIGVLCLVWLQ